MFLTTGPRGYFWGARSEFPARRTPGSPWPGSPPTLKPSHGEGVSLGLCHLSPTSSDSPLWSTGGVNGIKPPRFPVHRSGRKSDIQSKKPQIARSEGSPQGAPRPRTGSLPVWARPALRSWMGVPRGSASWGCPAVVLGLPPGGCGRSERTARPSEAARSSLSSALHDCFPSPGRVARPRSQTECAGRTPDPRATSARRFGGVERWEPLVGAAPCRRPCHPRSTEGCAALSRCWPPRVLAAPPSVGVPACAHGWRSCRGLRTVPGGRAGRRVDGWRGGRRAQVAGRQVGRWTGRW